MRPARPAIQAYQDAAAAGSWPSSPWPRQQPAVQQAAPARSAAAASPAPPPPSPSPAAAQGQPGQRVRTYRGLSASQFMHPLDKQNTALLRALPGLELLARNFMGPVAEQVLMLENIGTSVLAGPDQLPSLHKLLTEAAGMLGMEAPDLYVRQNPVPNAYTLAIAGRKPFVVMHTALLELLSPAEVQAVLAHELGHLKCDHGVWLTAANVLALGTVSLLPVVSAAVEEGLLRWLRAAELTCDRAALLVAQDSRVVVSALMKLAGGSPALAGELSVDAFLRQARSYDEATSSPVGWYLRNAQTRALSHPLPVLRAREIDRWSQSQQYQELVAANLPRSTGGSGRGASAGGNPGGSGGGARFQG
ncbi:protease-like protein isoform X1 [Micractinium conductrix]|uniref:Protease-like protein isoform X1 n=1 Tax=Micractinium conductrix TaxID=554055 RepID=A0A2P6VCY0_9CHLO|nr:protease-like protein isoform X1 [Micractinium conductrix]|eukprot:PSC71911.1 protease-like protein isoform X1 [Micractinium conductrix]